MKRFIHTARPDQYIKNLFVFAPLIFAGELFNYSLLINASWTFLSFCMAASSLYFFNDLCDRDTDSGHPDKKNRPIAAGLISPLQAGITSGFLFSVSLLIALFAVSIPVALTIAIYIIINVLYSLGLKNLVLIDIILVSTGYIIRIVAGGLSIGVPVSDWLLLCAGILALFLALSKRRSEFILSATTNHTSRKVLTLYSEKLLDQFISITATLTIITYSLYSILNVSHRHLIFTTPFVIYGIFRYLYIMYAREKGDNPTRELILDHHLLVTVLLWALASILIITYFQ